MSIDGGHISLEPTETSSKSRGASRQDAEAGLRAQLLAQVANSESDLENQIAQLRNAIPTTSSSAALDQAQTQLRVLSRLQQRIARADATGLVAIRGEVAASVAASQAAAQQAQQGTGASQSAEVALQQASAVSHQTVSDFERDFYGRRIFDPYLRFTSAEDQEAYRRREAERQQAIDKAMAEGTPQGNLKANRLAIAQLQDAGAHGADRSPEYRKRMDELVRSGNTLDSAIGASRATAAQQAEQGAPAAKEATDPLASVGAKSPDTKGAAATLIAAGISSPKTDDVGHGVANQPVQSTPPTRAI